jgi:hypothetical protein
VCWYIHPHLSVSLVSDVKTTGEISVFLVKFHQIDIVVILNFRGSNCQQLICDSPTIAVDSSAQEPETILFTVQFINSEFTHVHRFFFSFIVKAWQWPIVPSLVPKVINWWNYIFTLADWVNYQLIFASFSRVCH